MCAFCLFVREKQNKYHIIRFSLSVYPHKDFKASVNTSITKEWTNIDTIRSADCFEQLFVCYIKHSNSHQSRRQCLIKEKHKLILEEVEEDRGNKVQKGNIITPKRTHTQMNSEESIENMSAYEWRELSPVFVFFFVIALPLSCCFYRFLTRDDYAFCYIQNAHAFLSTLGKMQRIKYFLLNHCSVYVPGSTCSERVII